MKSKKNEDTLDYLMSRTEEIMKERIMNMDSLKENKMLRDLFKVAFIDGVQTATSLLLEVADVIGETKQL